MKKLIIMNLNYLIKIKEVVTIPPLKVKEIVVTICLIITTIIAILTYETNSKLQKAELKIKQLEYKNMKLLYCILDYM